MGTGGRAPLRGRTILVLLAIAIAFTLSCQLIIGLNEPPEDQLPPAEAGDTDTGVAVDAGADVDPCHHVFAPPMGIDDDPMRELPTITFAMHKVAMLGRLGWDAGPYDGGGGTTGFPSPEPPGSNNALGFDLDKACTCQHDNVHQGQASCTSNTHVVCDEDGGIDNALVNIYGTFGTLFGNKDPADGLLNVNDSIGNGITTLIMQIDKYNGLANDNEVLVTVLAGQYTHQEPAGTPQCQDAGPRQVKGLSGGPDGGPDYGPTWDGCDVWDISQKATPITSYVVNHQLVVIAAAFLPVPVGGASLNVQYAQSVGVLLPNAGTDGGFTYEDGVFSGRAGAADLMEAILTFRQIGSNMPACYDPNAVSLVKGSLCGALDLHQQQPEDFRADDAGVLLPCDSASFVFAFRQEPASVGVMISNENLLHSCADSGVDFSCAGSDAGQ